ncbi:uncharacterized protein LOC127781259 isoform X2 [Oryza glaberrima]|uniref:uncharacterized protein LOC127781259 isoform X2 n=1 Tax=Oryza glaberrima TaxID=4538 RepID=UPI00224C26A1|nr:uncharacterized protein LOC127781259 isoform X2 [Oryza glaberrima]
MEMESPWSLEAEVGHRVEDLWEVAEPQLSPSEKLNSCFEDIAVASFHRPLGSQVLMAYIIPPVLVSFARRVRPPLWFLATGTVVVLGRRLSYDWQQLQRKVGRSNLDDRSVNTTPSHNRPDLWYSHLLQNSLPGYPLHLPFYSSVYCRGGREWPVDLAAARFHMFMLILQSQDVRTIYSLGGGLLSALRTWPERCRSL